jgi:uncharacterized protein YndB with AHSA1/START domain
MKGFKPVMLGIVILLFAVTALLWLLGGRTFQYRAEVLVAAAPEQVFFHLTDPALLKQWIGGLVESTPMGDSTLRVGAKSREVIEENGRRFEMQSEVLRLEANRLLEVSLQNDFGQTISRYQLEPDNGRTRLTHTMHTNYKGLFVRLMAPFIGRAVQSKLDKDFNQLKRLAEKNR